MAADGADRMVDEYRRATGPAALIFGDAPRYRAALVTAARAGGARVIGDGPLADAAASLERQPGTAVAILDLGRDRGDDLDALLMLIGAGAAAARFDSVLIATPAQIDIVVARAGHAGTTVLVDPDRGQLAVAIAGLLAPRPATLAEPGGERQTRRLAELSEETARIARALAELAGGGDPLPDGSVPETAVLLAMTRTLLRLRRLRERFFAAALFADPVWDMPLDLFAARLERRQVAVSSLCIAAAVPPTTALRWIAAMTEQGMLARIPDPVDGRRVFLALTEGAAAAMTGYVAAALGHAAPTRD